MPAFLPRVGILSLDSTMQPNPAENAYWNNYDRKGRWKNRGRNNYDQNDGKPGVVYILANDAFPHLLKIGQSTRSAAARAQELNDSCGTESPGRFFVLHEVRTADCGRAEKRVHRQLKDYRFRKEYFKIEVFPALSEVQAACAFFDKKEEEKKRAADELRRAAAESETQSEQHVERATLSPSEEAAIYVGLSETERHQKTKSPDEGLQKKPKPAPVKLSPIEPSANLTPSPAQQSGDYAIAACPSCRQELRVPTAENLIIICPKCRCEFRRTASGQLYSHRLEEPVAPKTAPPGPPLDATPPLFEQPVPEERKAPQPLPNHAMVAKTNAPWWAYLVAALTVGVLFLILTRGNSADEVTTSASGPSPEERRLLADIERYVKSYQIPKPDPKGETNLRAVTQTGATIQFTYITTPSGERALSKNFDWPYIKESMRKLACAKPELQALIKRGVVVHYRLQRKNGVLTTAIACE